VQRIRDLSSHGKKAIAVSSIATTLVCAAPPAIGSTPAANDAADRIAAINTRVGGRIGVAALDTGTGQHIEYKANERFPMCSTFKVLAAAAVLKLVDEGKEYLDRMVPYAKEDILEYAPVTKEHLKEGRMTLGDLCAAAVEQSDNTPEIFCCGQSAVHWV
jgi:beta-lactamase class A